MNTLDPKPAAGGRSRFARPYVRHFWIVGLCFYLGAVWYIGWRGIRSELAALRPGILGAAAGMVIAGFWLRAFKWRCVLGPRRNAVGLFFLSKAAASLSPARVGELSPLLIPRHRNTRVGAWIVLDRIVEASVTLFLGVAGLLALRFISPAYAFALTLLLAALIAAVLYLATRRDFFLRLADRSGAPGWRQRTARFVAGISHEITLFNRRLPLVLTLTACAKCTDLWAIMLLYRSLSCNVGFLLVATVRCAQALAAAVPVTPDPTGVPQFAGAWLLNRVAGIPAPVLAAAIGLEVVLVNVVLWSSFGLAASDLRNSTSDPGPDA